MTTEQTDPAPAPCLQCGGRWHDRHTCPDTDDICPVHETDTDTGGVCWSCIDDNEHTEMDR